MPPATDSKRFSSAEGYFASAKAEENAHTDLTPPALRIIKRREQLEARASIQSPSRLQQDDTSSARSKVPDYYEDTNFVPSQPTRPSSESKLKLSQLTICRLLSAKSLSDIAAPDDPEEAKSLEAAWDLKQRKISSNCLENLPIDHGLTELFARVSIPSEEQ